VASYPDLPPDPVARPWVVQRWEHLAFLHWPYPAGRVQALLPFGLEVDTFDGMAWVALVPFRMVGVRPPFLPAPPWLTTFPETNVRTYVRGPDGGTGVWFASLEITRLLGVAVARTVFRVPYTWARMDLGLRDGTVTYWSRRRWPEPAGAASRVTVAIGERVRPDPLLRFLTNRWRAYTTTRSGRPAFAPVAHEPWTLHRAEIVELADDLVVAAGLPAPEGLPLVHTAPGVTARVGGPRRA
jgi:uncharacterized protein